jgi:hypothetical protein
MPETPVQTDERGPEKVTTVAALKKRAVHKDVTLPSGAVVDIKLPNLSQMIKANTLPNELVDAALRQQVQPGENAKEPKPLTREDLEQDWDFVEFIVPLTLHTPKVKAEDVADLDPSDVTMIANFAARRTDIDAIGCQLGGLDTVASFRKHRGFFDFDAAVADLS